MLPGRTPSAAAQTGALGPPPALPVPSDTAVGEAAVAAPPSAGTTGEHGHGEVNRRCVRLRASLALPPSHVIVLCSSADYAGAAAILAVGQPGAAPPLASNAVGDVVEFRTVGAAFIAAQAAKATREDMVTALAQVLEPLKRATGPGAKTAYLQARRRVRYETAAALRALTGWGVAEAQAATDSLFKLVDRKMLKALHKGAWLCLHPATAALSSVSLVCRSRSDPTPSRPSRTRGRPPAAPPSVAGWQGPGGCDRCAQALRAGAAWPLTGI